VGRADQSTARNPHTLADPIPGITCANPDNPPSDQPSVRLPVAPAAGPFDTRYRGMRLRMPEGFGRRWRVYETVVTARRGLVQMLTFEAFQVAKVTWAG
jgi:hypothetical protein